MTENNFKFRSKFEKLIADENRQVITTAFEKFCGLDQDRARNFLWSLTYHPNIAAETLDGLGLNLEIVSSNDIIALRNELRHQYEKIYPDFLTVDISDECKTAFDALVKNTDTIVSYIVYEHCRKRLYLSDMHRTLYLLNDDNDKNYFGGIRSLFFDIREAGYLKPYHTQIHDLLNALYDTYRSNFFPKKTNVKEGAEVATETTEETNTEVFYEMSEEKPEEISEEKPEETPEEKAIQSSSQFKTLTVEEILTHKDIFTSFVADGDFNALCHIGNLGFDLNVVMAKKTEISLLIHAVESFNG